MSKYETTLRITEIFHSLQGESTSIGLPTVFVRLTGCPLRCLYCDTAYAFHGGKRLSLDEVLARVIAFNCHHVTVSGGEPLAQPACFNLLSTLCDAGLKVSLETSGAIDIGLVDPRVMVVMDLKTPDSGEESKNLFSNLAHLKACDQIKFVVCSRADYDWARALIAEHQLHKTCEVLLSPSWEQLPARQLADWVVEDNLPVRFQVQLHKVLWQDEPGR